MADKDKPWLSDPIIHAAPTADAGGSDSSERPLPSANAQPQPGWREMGRNIAAGVQEGAASVANILSDPFGNLIGKPVEVAAQFAHDALAPVFGYERFSDKDRSALLSDVVPQPGTRLVEAIDRAGGAPTPSEVPATTQGQQIARKAAAGATAAGALGLGAGPALAGTGGAVVGDVASRFVPEWAAPGTELVSNAAGAWGTGRAVTPAQPVVSPARQQLVGVLDTENVPLTAGERTGSKPLLKTEQMLGQTPGSSGGIARDVTTQQGAVNRAVASKAGLDTDTLTHEVLNKHMKTIGGEIGNLTTSNNMQLPTPFVQQLGQVRQGLRYEKTAVAQELGARLDQLRDMITVDPATGQPVLAGPHFQNLMSDLRSAITAADPAARRPLIQVRDMLRLQMEASMNPADAARWRELNRHYANGAVIQDAMGAAGANTAEGNISLLQLRGAINRSLGSDAYAKGYGDLNELARAGQSVLRKPPDSGTPQGMLINTLLKGVPLATGGAGGYLGGAEGLAVGLATPWAISTAMRGRIPFTNYSPGQAYLSNQLMQGVNPAVVAAITNAANQIDEQKNKLGPGRGP